MDRRWFIKKISVLTVPLEQLSKGFASEVFSESPSFSNEANALPVNTLSDEYLAHIPKIGVIAVGSFGGSPLSDFYGTLPHLSRLIVIDTSSGALHEVEVNQETLIDDVTKIWLGKTDSLRIHAPNVWAEIAAAVAGLEIAFIVAGLDGGADNLISLLVAEVLSAKSIMSICVAIMPFDIESKHHQEVALAGARALVDAANVVFPISNKPFSMSDQRDGNNLINISTIFERIYNGTISPIAKSGLITVDVDDLNVMKSSNGFAVQGYGIASGENAAVEAAQAAISDSLLGENQLRLASSLWVSIEGPPNKGMKMRDINNIMKTITNAVRDKNHEQNIIFGATYTEDFSEEFRVTILASGVPFEYCRAFT